MPRKTRDNNGYVGIRQYDSIGGRLSPNKMYHYERDDLKKWTGSGVTSFNSNTPDGVGDYLFPFPENRPTFWLSMPSIVEGEQKFAGLLAIYKGATGNTGSTADPNYVFFTMAGNYIVDWGNGVTQSFTSGTIAQYQYNYEDISSSTDTPDGYRQVLIQAYPQTGATLTSIDFRTRGWTGIYAPSTSWGPSWLDMKIAGRNISSFSINGGAGNVSATNLRNFEFVGESAITNAGSLFAYLGYLQKIRIPKMVKNATNVVGLFNSCNSLRDIGDFEVSPSATDFSSIFAGCALTVAPNVNTSNVTNMNNMFSGCVLLKTVPTYNTSKVTNFGTMFYQCHALNSLPLLDTSSGQNFSNMFSYCYSLTEIPPFDTRNATNMNGLFEYCRGLKRIPQLNTSKVTNFGNMYRYINVPRVPWMDTSSATDMSGMFWISAVSEIPLYDTRKVTSFLNFLNLNSNIKYVPPLSGVCCSNFAGMFSSNNYQLRVGTILGVKENISYANCYMLSAEALNDIFTNLATVGASGSGTKTITITSTQGATNCNRSIAVAKGWSVVG